MAAFFERDLARTILLFSFGTVVAIAGCSGGGGSSPTPSANSSRGGSNGGAPTPTADPGATPTPGPAGSSVPVSYNASTACINHVVFTNTVLKSGEGEFATNGLDRTYWGGTKTRTYAPTATWGPGFFPSWGRHQYDTYFGDSSDGTGYDPFSMVTDSGASGSPKALRIEAIPMPSPIATSLTVLANDQWQVTNETAGFDVPAEGGSLTIGVNNPSSAQQGWHVGIGYQGAPIMFVGTLTSGGASSAGTGGSSPWTISNVHIYAGSAGTAITPGVNDEGGLRAYSFPAYYAGALDMNVNQEYGFFVARMRLPQPLPGLSPAWWMLETGGVGTNGGQLLRSEWDIAEQFAAVYGYELNAGNILWNSGSPGLAYGCGLSCPATNNTTTSGATGVYPWPSTSSGNFNSAYHDYGVLIQSGGPGFPRNYSGSAGGVYVENGTTWSGTTFFLDGYPIAGHIGGPDLTQGSPDKELMAMFQIGSPGTWLDPNSTAASNPWPQYMYVQWLRAYKPSSSSC